MLVLSRPLDEENEIRTYEIPLYSLQYYPKAAKIAQSIDKVP